MDPEDLVAAVRDSLICAEPWVGGAIGLLPQKYEDAIRAYMTKQGWLGRGGCLTRRGALEAFRLQRAEFWE